MAVNANDKAELTFKIEEHLGIINSYKTGWNKELNLVTWNNGTPKYDIRDWDPEHEHMSRGITLHADEMRKLRSMIADRQI
ncbi:MAG: YdbC family protein [Anaerovoracaceae bacterium]|jgi:hypothetical protein